jgi:hypothetical protein
VLPPINPAGRSVGDVLPAPSVSLDVPNADKLLPGSSLNSAYVRRVEAWQSAEKLYKGLKTVKRGFQLLEVVSTVAAVCRAYSRSEALNWHSPELKP